MTRDSYSGYSYTCKGCGQSAFHRTETGDRGYSAWSCSTHSCLHFLWKSFPFGETPLWVLVEGSRWIDYVESL